ncbi:SbcC protein [Pseudomonas phage PhiPA3]|uniref:SbcC protein n=1 Tax=Pseudomonas phage PhiPA3 TaxID=998086 RepID=F8SK59_BPPA3|nr:SbcC protein [Pseudomonas phage PhiPA3]AEH03613.1 SbcC protein [Pseudomonas phage PhiPA3]
MIGSNGSGKSSIMDELSPLPAKKDEFEKGGEKEVHCYHRDHFYVVHSVYGHGTGRHSFKRDSVELNPGGTFKVQEELCMQEFGLNVERHRIMTGRIKFTNLPVSKRREYLTEMSVVNLDFAFDTFKMVSTEQRNQKGVIDTITRRLVAENHDIPSDTEMSLMRDNVAAMTKRLNRLFQEKQSNAPKAQFFSTDAIEQEREAIITKAKQLLRSYMYIPSSVKCHGRDGAIAQLNSVKQEHSAITAVINRLAEELEKLRTSTPQSMEVSPDEIRSLREQYDTLLDIYVRKSNQVGQYNASFPLVQFDLAGDPHQKLDTLFERWFASINAFPDNADARMSREEAVTRQARLKELKGVRRQIDDKHQSVCQRIARMKGCEHVKCPNCNHDFQPGVAETEAVELEASKLKLEEAMDRLDIEVKEHEEYLEQFQDYSGHVYNFVQINKDYPEFHELWSYCASKLIMFRTPAQHKTDAIMWHTTMRTWVDAQQALARAQVIEQRLKIIDEIDQDAIGFMKRRTADLETEINEMYTRADVFRHGVLEIEEAIDEVDNYVAAAQAVFDEYEIWQTKVRNHCEHLLDRAYTEEISAIQLELAEHNRQLNILQQRETTIRTLENEVALSTEAYDELSLIIKALSPKGGLIGRYLLGFLQGVVSVVNAHIDEVWSYPMEVLPSRVDRDELDYRFPLKVGGGKVITSDIEDGSSSQLEMVNYGFRMAQLKFLGLEDYPLFLDEFGRTFDEQHRANLIPYLSRLVENGLVEQIFYISHFQSTHGAFNQAEFMVLDPTNVTVPEVYNKNVVIK